VSGAALARKARRVPLVPVLHNNTAATPPAASRTPSSTRSVPELELQTAPHQTRRAGVAGDGPDHQSSGELSTSIAKETAAKDSKCGSGEAAVAPAEPAEAARVDQAGAGLDAAGRIKVARSPGARWRSANTNRATTPITGAVASGHQRLRERQVISTPP
jgi:hypothetical protein